VAILVQALSRRALSSDPVDARRLRLAVVAPVAWALPFVFLAAVALGSADGYDPVWDRGAEVGGLTAVLSLLGLAIVLAAWRDRGWGLGTGAEAISPWEERHGIRLDRLDG
jgi:hypothetical protein